MASRPFLASGSARGFPLASGRNDGLEKRHCLLRRHEIRDELRPDWADIVPPSHAYRIQRGGGCQGKTGGFAAALQSLRRLCCRGYFPRHRASFRAACTPPTSTFSPTSATPPPLFTFSRIPRPPRNCLERSTV